MNALLFERPVWFATGPLMFEEEAQEMEDFTYHRPVLVRKRSNCSRRAPARSGRRCDLRRRRSHRSDFANRRRCPRARSGSRCDRACERAA